MTNGEIMDDLWNDFVETESLETEIKNGRPCPGDIVENKDSDENRHTDSI